MSGGGRESEGGAGGGEVRRSTVLSGKAEVVGTEELAPLIVSNDGHPLSLLQGQKGTLRERGSKEGAGLHGACWAWEGALWEGGECGTPAGPLAHIYWLR